MVRCLLPAAFLRKFSRPCQLNHLLSFCLFASICIESNWNSKFKPFHSGQEVATAQKTMRLSASAPTELPSLRWVATGETRNQVSVITSTTRRVADGLGAAVEEAWCGPISPRPTPKRLRTKRSRTRPLGNNVDRSLISEGSHRKRLTERKAVARALALSEVAAHARTARKASALRGSFAHRSARPVVLDDGGRPLLQRRFTELPSHKERNWNSVTSLATSVYDESDTAMQFEDNEDETEGPEDEEGAKAEETEFEGGEEKDEWEFDEQRAHGSAPATALRNGTLTFYDKRSNRRRRAPIPFYLFYTDWRRTAPAEKVDLSPWRSGDDDVYTLASINAKLGGNTTQGRRKGVLRNRLHEKVLRDLSLRGCSSVTDGAIIEIGDSCRTLRSINLSGCVRITDHGIIKMRAKASHLEEIVLASQDGITDDGIRAIAKGCLHLRHIELRDLQQISDISMHLLSTRSKRESDLSVVVVKVSACVGKQMVGPPRHQHVVLFSF